MVRAIRCSSGSVDKVYHGLFCCFWIHTLFYVNTCTATDTPVTELPLSPWNVTVSHVRSLQAVVIWQYTPGEHIIKFEMTHRPLTRVRVKYKIVTELDRNTRTFIVAKLIPDTLYELHLAARNLAGMSNNSNSVLFKTKPMVTVAEEARLEVRVGDFLIVGSILLAWIASIILFLHKWGKIRIVQPRELRYKHSPKNIDTIKVVKRATDSVIYKSHSAQIKQNMKAREKKIERMNTMPVIMPTVQEHIEMKDKKLGRKDKKLDRMKTVPVINIDNAV